MSINFASYIITQPFCLKSYRNYRAFKLKSTNCEVKLDNKRLVGGVIILDFMVIVKAVFTKTAMKEQLASTSFTFHDAAVLVMKKIVKIGQNLKTTKLHVVADPYPEGPVVKGVETAIRVANKRPMLFTIGSGGTNKFPLSTMDAYFAMTDNKRAFINFCMDCLLELSFIVEIKLRWDMFIVFGNGPRCLSVSPHKPTNGGDKEWNIQDVVPELISNHVEADTMLILHLAYATTTYSDKQMPIYIKSVDTDVFALTLANTPRFKR